MLQSTTCSDDVEAASGETLLSITLWSRYYGVGYERVDLLTICAIAEWCERNIQGCEVWYGGDSSGVCITPFPEAERKVLRNHLYSSDGRSYFSYDKRSEPPLPPRSDCKLCIPDHEPSRFGWGAAYAAYNCAGCGKRFITNDGGLTWTDKDRFDDLMGGKN